MQSVTQPTLRHVSTAKDLNFESSLGQSLRSVSPSIDLALNKVLERDGISYIQWVVLLSSCELGTVTATELARRFGYKSGLLSRLIDHLVRLELIARSRTDGDRRLVVLSLTARGEVLVRSTLPRVAQVWNGVLCKFDDSELELLMGFLQRLHACSVRSSS
jgi:DNA-binding MarR family transcriptional regulator